MRGFTIDEILRSSNDIESKTPGVFYHVERTEASNELKFCRESPNSFCSLSSIEMEEDKCGRRPRTSITLCQRDFLECEFQKERYPTLLYINKLSSKINLSQYVIKVWFQNRRAKYRKEGHKRKPTINIDYTDSAKNVRISSTNCVRKLRQNFSASNSKILRRHSTSYDLYGPRSLKCDVWFQKDRKCCSSAADKSKCCYFPT
uniref:Homeobox transcription factor Rx1 n=1 Tax=Hydra vulgaris TaxID=6087 RepID=A0A4D6REY3_HYDVU|nr:homeobox transcription factor Rx1 [Hydra vulgaris]